MEPSKDTAGSDQLTSTTWKSIELEKEQELRFEIDADKSLLEGEAEFFGTELAQHREYTISGVKGAIFSFNGATLEVNGRLQSYVASDTPMISYLNVHKALEDMRDKASSSSTDGPRVVLVGPTDSGKSTLAKLLLNYAARKGRTPVYVDVDVGQGSITMPSMIAATIVDKPIPLGQSDFTIDSPPLVYFYGSISPDHNAKLYKMQVDNIAKGIERKFANSVKAKSSGIVINTCGWVEGLGYELLLHAIESLKADVVLVIDHDRLFNDLKKAYLPAPHIKVLKLSKSGGVVVRNTNYRKMSRTKKIKEYFYGPLGELYPHSLSVSFSDVSIYKLGSGPLAPSSALPIGATSTVDPVRLTEMAPTSELVHSILGVSHSKSPDHLLDTNIAGFVYITEINMHTQKITLLSPCPGNLPSRYLILASLKWLE